MAKRFVYLPIKEKPFVKSVEVEFKWEPGMSLSQKKKSGDNLHEAILERELCDNLLECSRAGVCELGTSLSAFNLGYEGNLALKLENVYQGSKVFENRATKEKVQLGSIHKIDAFEAKKAIRTMEGNWEYTFVGFKLPEDSEVRTFKDRFEFYNYIYIISLAKHLDKNEHLKEELLKYNGFTDVMLRWYDGSVTSCQAHATAMYVGMYLSGELDGYICDLDTFLKAFD